MKVAELGSLTLAAQALGYTQSNVSHILSGLESDFGFRLFSRGRAGAKLTSEGERILPAVRAVVESEALLQRAVEEIRGLEAGTLRVAAFSSVAVHWLPGIIQSFESAYPRIDFRVLSGDYHDVEQWLSDGSVDIGFLTLPTALDCRILPLYEDRLLAVLPPEHPGAEGSRFPVQRCADEAFITLLESSDRDSIRPLEEAGITPNVKYKTKDDYAIIAMVEKGLGMSIMPELLLRGHLDKVHALELDPPARRVIALAIPQESQNSPAALRFAEFVGQWLRENGGTQ